MRDQPQDEYTPATERAFDFSDSPNGVWLTTADESPITTSGPISE